MPSTGTSNTTSFARDALTATALILDGLAAVGDERRSLLTQAQTLIYAAHKSAYGDDELALAAALNAVIKGYERTGADRR
jgi:hypothetical protein